jgi:hypothetical protein
MLRRTALVSGVGAAVGSPEVRSFYRRYALILVAVMVALHVTAVALTLPPYLALQLLHWAVGDWLAAPPPPALFAVVSALSGYLSLAVMLVRDDSHLFLLCAPGASQAGGVWRGGGVQISGCLVRFVTPGPLSAPPPLTQVMQHHPRVYAKLEALFFDVLTRRDEELGVALRGLRQVPLLHQLKALALKCVVAVCIVHPRWQRAPKPPSPANRGCSKARCVVRS